MESSLCNLKWWNPTILHSSKLNKKPAEGEYFMLSSPNDINDSVLSYFLVKVKSNDTCDIYEVRVDAVQMEIPLVTGISLESFFDGRGGLVFDFTYVKYEELPPNILEAFERKIIE